jgi:transcriptional regulator with XRE-family HTH domain
MKRLKELRKEKCVYQKDIADLLGLTDRNYRRYEMGEVDPPTSKTIMLADYFDVSVDYLVGRSDDPKKK